MKRPTKLQTYMELAETIAKRSHDTETRVGAVLVNNNNGAILAASFNGFVRSAPDDQLPTTRPDKYCYIIHAEENIIANCARLGISMDNCTLISTMSPCTHCMRLLWQCSVTKVIAKEKYRDFEKILQMKDLRVSETVTPEGFYELLYTVE